LSEVGVETLHRAAAVHPITDLQIEYSLISRGIEDRILAACGDLGISITAYGVLSRGLISGHWSKARSLQDDARGRMPRFSPQNLSHNLCLVDELRKLADTRGISVAQLAIAWVLARGDNIVPLVGPRRPAQLEEALGAPAVSLTQEDLEHIETAVPINAAAGYRCAPQMVPYLDSEKS
jgi:aryl-alcohol dehydrogenase-like predicted oxidoreductase